MVSGTEGVKNKMAAFVFHSTKSNDLLRRVPFLGRKLSSKTPNQTNPFNYCQELVRKHDYENFLAALLLPVGARESTIAIRAFNVSVAQVQDQVSQNMIGQMRMKFWMDALENIFHDAPPAQPVTIQLYKAIKQHKLSKRWLQRLVSSREDVLTLKSFSSLSEVETYAENSVSSVLYLTLEALNIRNVNADHAASHLGRAQGIATMLRAIPFNAHRNRVYLPTELLLKHKVSQNEIIRGSADQKLRDLVFDVASTAHAHNEKARAIISQAPKEARVALLPTLAVSAYLEQLRKTSFNVYDGRLQQRNNLLAWQLWWNNFRGRI